MTEFFAGDQVEYLGRPLPHRVQPITGDVYTALETGMVGTVLHATHPRLLNPTGGLAYIVQFGTGKPRYVHGADLRRVPSTTTTQAHKARIEDLTAENARLESLVATMRSANAERVEQWKAERKYFEQQIDRLERSDKAGLYEMSKLRGRVAELAKERADALMARGQLHIENAELKAENAELQRHINEGLAETPDAIRINALTRDRDRIAAENHQLRLQRDNAATTLASLYERVQTEAGHLRREIQDIQEVVDGLRSRD